MKVRDKNLLILGSSIRRRRKELNISQEKLAFLADIDRSYVSGIERGERNISLNTLFKICLHLDSQPSELLSDIIICKDEK